MTFIENDQYAFHIVEYMMRCHYEYIFDENVGNAIDWLGLSSRIESVSIPPSKYDDGLMVCRSALDYELSRSKMLSSFTTELMQFQFVWGALESMIAECVPQDETNSYGKINALCGYLKNSDAKAYLPKGYEGSYALLIKYLKNIRQYRIDLRQLELGDNLQIPMKSYLDISGAGVYLVYRIRNRFAHGSLRFPESEEYSEYTGVNKDVIPIATRITLMTIVMLLLDDIKSCDDSLDPQYCCLGSEGVSAIDYLKSLCL